jgi:hypothetical protein
LKGRSLAGRALRLVLLGATLGPALDYAHVATGAIAYPHPDAFGLAWWVPLLYAGASLGIGLTHPAMDRVLDRRAARPITLARLVAGIAALAAVWVASGALGPDSRVVTAAIAPAALLTWWALDGTRAGVVLAAGTAVAGVAVEVTLAGAGLFRYLHPEVAGVATWLPWIYVTASPAMGNVGRYWAGSD